MLSSDRNFCETRPVCLNLLPDYISLIETRIILGKIRDRKIALSAGIAVDAILTAGIFAIVGGYAFTVAFTTVNIHFDNLPIVNLSGHYWDVATVFFREIVSYGVAFQSHENFLSFGVFLYSTFFTSAWLWLYAGGIFFIRLLARMGPVLRFLKWLLPIDEKPMRAIGTATFIPAIAVSGLISWIF